MTKLRTALMILTSIAVVYSPAAPSKEQQAQEAFDRAMNVYAVDAPASIPLFQRAAKMGHAEAMVRLGYIYQTSEHPRFKDSIQWYKRAVEAGNTAAIYEIGSMIEKGGRGIKPDLTKAIEWYEKGVSNNSLKSAEALTRIYASCNDSKYHDGPQAMKYAMTLVSKDPRNPHYMDMLAAACARNLEFDNAMKAASQAVSLSPLDEAAERRERREAYAIGMPYPAIASDAWILQAAEKENIWAVMQLAALSSDELSDDYDPVNARHWYGIAAQNDDPEALLKLGQMCFNGEGGEEDMKKAFWCYAESAEAGVNQAYAPLARMYVGGKGTGQDFEKALEWYKKAADAGMRQYNFQLNAIRMFLRAPVRPSPEDLFKQAQAMASEDWRTPKGETRTYSQKTNEILTRYWLAAEQDHLEAMKELADMFFYGKRYFVRDGDLDKTSGGLSSNYTKALAYYRQLERRGIICPELETCHKLAMIELKDRRERQRKKDLDTRRAAERTAFKRKA